MRYLACLTLIAATACAWCEDPDAITALRDMHLQTQLVRDGQSTCMIAAPSDAQYAALASRLAAAIGEKLGAAPPVVDAAQVTDDQLAQSNAIALGVFAVNEVTDRLYRRALVACDWTGPWTAGGYEIRTVHDPWLSGTNVVAIAGITQAGCEAAVDRFIEMLGDVQDGAIGPMIETSGEGLPAALTDEQVTQYQGKIEAETSSRSMGGMAASYCDSYFLSGDRGWAQVFLSAMRRLVALSEAEGAADDVRTCRYLFLQFDRTEEGPAFSDAERLELTNLFYRFARLLGYAKAKVAPSETPHGNNWNAMGASWAAMYFARNYPQLEIGRSMLEKMDVYYEPNMLNWRVNEDCPGYGNTTLIGNYEWSLHRPDPRYIEDDGLRKMADLYMMVTNNLGQVCGFGDASMVGSKYFVQAIPHAGWLYRDGRYLWFWDWQGGKPARFWVPPDVLPRQQPDDLLGVATMPLAEWVYKRTNYEAERGFPIEQCFDKASFRAGFEPTDEYLCIGGFGYGFHSHEDANAIINYSDEGSTCLYDDGYMIPALSEHNTVTVLRDGWAGHVPELAQRAAEADFDGVGMFRSRLAGYNGVDWDRCVIWPKGRYFLVVDDLRATESGDYNFQCIWRTLGRAELQGRRWTSEADGRVFNLIACSDAALSQKESAGFSLNSPPLALDKARRLVEASGRKLALGDALQFANLLYTTPGEGKAQLVNAHRLGDTTTWLIEDDGQLAMAGINRSASLAGLQVQASVFHLAGDVLTAAGAVEVRAGGPLLASNLPVGLRLDLATGRALVAADEPVEVTYQGA
ncbi:MAG TPA: hypothetical protein VM283_02080, partial [Armatimonadota bacterium]|nr:hypothetical protein [Armatimonadota bacterium]